MEQSGICIEREEGETECRVNNGLELSLGWRTSAGSHLSVLGLCVPPPLPLRLCPSTQLLRLRQQGLSPPRIAPILLSQRLTERGVRCRPREQRTGRFPDRSTTQEVIVL